MKAYKYKLKMNRAFEAKCVSTLDICRELYNACLQERRDAYTLARVTIDYHDQRRQLPEIKINRQDVKGVHSGVLQDVLRRCHKAFVGFYRRHAAGQTPGYPRFKSQYRYNSFTYVQSGFWLEGDKLELSKIGSCRVRLSRPVEGVIKNCTIKREVDGWYVIFGVEENQSRFIPKTGNVVGIDVGVEAFVTFSTGERIDNPRILHTAEAQIKTAHRRVSRRRKGSTRYRKAVDMLARRHQDVKRKRADFHHKVALQVIRENDVIAIESLNIAGLMKNHYLAKSIADVAWYSFFVILSSKAANAGRQVVKVAAQYTSQDCAQCGNRIRKSLATRIHACIVCGFVAHRDVNAALNIKQKGTGSPFGDGLRSPREPRIWHGSWSVKESGSRLGARDEAGTKAGLSMD